MALRLPTASVMHYISWSASLHCLGASASDFFHDFGFLLGLFCLSELDQHCSTHCKQCGARAGTRWGPWKMRVRHPILTSKRMFLGLTGFWYSVFQLRKTRTNWWLIGAWVIVNVGLSALWYWAIVSHGPAFDIAFAILAVSTSVCPFQWGANSQFTYIDTSGVAAMGHSQVT